MRRAWRAFRNAFFSDGFRRFGFPFARDYLRAAWHGARHWGDTRAGVMSLLGCRIAYPNYSAAFFLLHEIFVNGTYAFEAATPRPRIVDAGANIGMAVVFFKRLYPDAQVIALEPDPNTFARLEETVQANRLDSVRLVNAAVADHDGPLTFYTSERPDASLVASLDPHWGGATPRQVQGLRLSSVIDGPVDLLKLDIEGAEYAVVRELVESGAIDGVREAVIEIHDAGAEPDGPAMLARRLREAGMDVTMTAEDPVQGNGFVRARRRTASAAR